MSEIKVQFDSCLSISDDLRGYVNRLRRIQSDIPNIRFDSAFQMKAQELICNRIRDAERLLEKHTNDMTSMHQVLGRISVNYKQTENAVASEFDFGVIAGMRAEGNAAQSKYDDFCRLLKEKYGWGELLAGAGYIGEIYNLINEMKKNETVGDGIKSAVKAYQFLDGAAKTFKNYMKIGNAVGTSTAMAWWAKRVTGLRPLGRASTAKNPLTRFANNLTNKTSPFHSQFENVLKNFKGENGATKAVASWAGVAITGVVNWFDNKEEQENANGSMSDGRVIAETVTETAVDTALTYGAGIVVGAAVTTVIGTTATPAVIVVAASGLVIAGINAGVEAITGKTVTEWVSDSILDFGEAAVNTVEAVHHAVGETAKNIANSVGKWFDKLFYSTQQK